MSDLSQTESKHVERIPICRVIILGAGRNVRGALPPAMVNVGRKDRVMDWLLRAFSVLPQPEICFVSGYKANTVMEQYAGVHFYFNADWANTGPVASLALAPFGATRATYVCYSDIVFHPELVHALDRTDADVVAAIDTRWQVRFEGRTRVELEASEKVIVQNGDINEIGKHVSVARATGEFAGLVKFSASVIETLRTKLTDGSLGPKSGLPDVIQAVIRTGAQSKVVDVQGNWAELNAPQDLARFILGTKAESLHRLRPLVRKGQIAELFSFTHGRWKTDPKAVLSMIQQMFPETKVIVRSSALSEDNWLQSSAGAHKSVLSVSTRDPGAISGAVEEVVNSYRVPHEENQVLVQEMLKGVGMSGVIMTRSTSMGAPYYVINFDNVTKRTDTVTSGDGSSVRTIFLHRDGNLRDGLPPELTLVHDAVREVEELVGHDSLDIEFAVTEQDRVQILQVRPIAVAHRDMPMDDEKLAAGVREAIRYYRELQKPIPPLVGKTTQFSVMTDWNPAEMIGTKPKRLALSLYRYLITDETWALQRAEYGYRDVRPCNLLVEFLGHPYIDVRVDFNSFVPADLSDELTSRLVDYYLDRLAKQPELHDKVEFDILYTCMTFDFDDQSKVLKDAGFNNREIGHLADSLLRITRRGIARCESDRKNTKVMEDRFERIQNAELWSLDAAHHWLEDARRIGLLLFSHLARNAFVGMALLRSLCRTGALAEKECEAFQASLRTVPSLMQEHARLVKTGEMGWRRFVRQYGHLRPGTYDITSPSYATEPEEYLRPMVDAASSHPSSVTPFRWKTGTKAAISRELKRLDLGVDVNGFERFLRLAIEGREWGKFTFSRNLNAALEAIADFGASHGISREELSHIRVHELMGLRCAAPEHASHTLQMLSKAGREAYLSTQAVCLPGQIFSETDFVCFEQLRAEPNFVTRSHVRARVACLSERAFADHVIDGKIVIVPNADPGYDWVFSRKIAGLITMYGGANSHMAVRAAEFRLPAAIGVGELLYEDICKAEMIELNCAARRIQIIR